MNGDQRLNNFRGIVIAAFFDEGESARRSIAPLPLALGVVPGTRR
jgi:hypothetical protein